MSLLCVDGNGVVHVRSIKKNKRVSNRMTLIILVCEKGGEACEEVHPVPAFKTAFVTCLRCLAAETE